MMTKQEHIDYWIRTANDDWDAALSLFDNKKYVQSLFFAHLTIEKWCKAYWVKDNENNTPPRIHNLVRLIKSTKLEITDEDLIFLEEFNDFQLEGRYPDYLFEIYKRCDRNYTKQLINKIKLIIECLQKKML